MKKAIIVIILVLGLMGAAVVLLLELKQEQATTLLAECKVECDAEGGVHLEPCRDRCECLYEHENKPTDCDVLYETGVENAEHEAWQDHQKFIEDDMRCQHKIPTNLMVRCEAVGETYCECLESLRLDHPEL